MAGAGPPCLWGDCFTPGCSHMYMCGLMLVLFWLVQAPKTRRGHLPPITSIVTPCCTGVPCFTVWGRLTAAVLLRCTCTCCLKCMYGRRYVLGLA